MEIRIKVKWVCGIHVLGVHVLGVPCPWGRSMDISPPNNLIGAQVQASPLPSREGIPGSPIMMLIQGD